MARLAAAVTALTSTWILSLRAAIRKIGRQTVMPKYPETRVFLEQAFRHVLTEQEKLHIQLFDPVHSVPWRGVFPSCKARARLVQGLDQALWLNIRRVAGDFRPVEGGHPVPPVRRPETALGTKPFDPRCEPKSADPAVTRNGGAWSCSPPDFSSGPDAFEVVEVPTPKPVGDEVLVRIHAAGINFFETLVRQNRYPATPTLPAILGVEAAGVVEGLGDRANEDLIGARVAIPLFAAGRAGGYAEYVAISGTDVVPVPDEISFEQAAALLVQGLSASYLLRQARLKVSQS